MNVELYNKLCGAIGYLQNCNKNYPEKIKELKKNKKAISKHTSFLGVFYFAVFCMMRCFLLIAAGALQLIGKPTTNAVSFAEVIVMVIFAIIIIGLGIFMIRKDFTYNNVIVLLMIYAVVSMIVIGFAILCKVCTVNKIIADRYPFYLFSFFAVGVIAGVWSYALYEFYISCRFPISREKYLLIGYIIIFVLIIGIIVLCRICFEKYFHEPAFLIWTMVAFLISVVCCAVRILIIFKVDIPAEKEYNKRVIIHNDRVDEEIAKMKDLFEIYKTENEYLLNFLPPDYRYNTYAIGYMAYAVKNGLADSLKEALKCFLNECQRKEAEQIIARQNAEIAEMQRKLNIAEGIGYRKRR